MQIGNTTFFEKAEAGKALLDAIVLATSDERKIGTYRGFDMYLSFNYVTREIKATLRGTMQYSNFLGDDADGNIIRLNNLLKNIAKLEESAVKQLERTYKEIESAKEGLNKPFPREEELIEKKARLEMLNAELNTDNITRKHAEETKPDDSSELEETIDYEIEYGQVEEFAAEHTIEDIKPESERINDYISNFNIHDHIIIGGIPNHFVTPPELQNEAPAKREPELC